MRILVIEDQPQIGKAIKKGLTEEDFAVDLATNIADGAHLAIELDYDTLILDLMLPDGSGFDFLHNLRKKNSRTPVLILTAKDSLHDKTRGFDLGADDYLTKPFAFDELLGRVRALTRRKYQHYSNLLGQGNLQMDLTARTARVMRAGQEKALNLTAKEFIVLEFLLLRHTHILSRDKIMEHLYPESAELGTSNVIDVFINKLRRKLEASGASIEIESVRGEVYVIR